MQLTSIIAELWGEALLQASPEKASATVRQWLGDADLTPEDDGVGRVAEAMGLAVDLQLYQPSLTGSTTLDRFARKWPVSDRMTAAALEALRQARYRVLDLEGRRDESTVVARDPFTGETLHISDEVIPEEAFGWRVAGRMCRLSGDIMVTLGPLMPLDAASRTVVDNFVRPGRGLVNPERCAAALYEHIVRHGVMRIHGLNSMPASPQEDVLSANDTDGLGALANGWADLGPGTAPDPEEIAEVRERTSVPSIVACLLRIVLARRAKTFRLADAYVRIASLQIETLDLRERVGIGGDGVLLDGVTIAIDSGIADGLLPRDVRDLYDDLLVRVGARNAARGTATAAGGDLDRVLQRIRALRAKTTEQGCSEQEALAAAEKVAELLDRYGLSLSELEIKEQVCEGFGIDTERRRRGPFDACIPSIAEFCDCRVWTVTSVTQSIRYIFFGLPADVEAAHYLYALIEVTFETETATFKHGDIYTQTASGGRRNAVSSFQTGLSRGLSSKLAALKRERTAANLASSGRDLVPLKASVIDEDLDKLGLSFHVKPGQRRKRVRTDAYEAGRAAGQKFEPHRGIGSSE